MRIAGSMFPAAILLLFTAAPTFADDRAPTAEEKAAIESVLKAEGFTSWGKIELDNGNVWEVDDAIHNDGREYDLELDPKNLAITDRDPD